MRWLIANRVKQSKTAIHVTILVIEIGMCYVVLMEIKLK